MHIPYKNEYVTKIKDEKYFDNFNDTWENVYQHYRKKINRELR